jgi:thiol-disulfide isomerase/thioredoxin
MLLFTLWLGAWLAAAQTSAPDAPQPSPELKVTLTTGQPFVLSSWRGKVVAVEFLYTTCPHCQQLATTTSKLIGEYGARGFQAIGVAFNPGAQSLAPEFVKRFGVTFPVGVGTNDTMFDYAGPPTQAFRLPYLLFVDRKGFIRGRFTGEDKFFEDEEANLRQWIERLVKEPGRASPARRSK